MMIVQWVLLLGIVVSLLVVCVTGVAGGAALLAVVLFVGFAWSVGRSGAVRGE